MSNFDRTINYLAAGIVLAILFVIALLAGCRSSNAFPSTPVRYSATK
jgi:hypothetical protein